MQLLLDTHLLLWAVGEPERLDAALIQMLEDPLNTPVFSVVSLWELVIKRGLDRPDFRVEPSLIRHALLEGGWRELPVEARHAFAVGRLPAWRSPAASRAAWRRGPTTCRGGRSASSAVSSALQTAPSSTTSGSE